MSVRRWPLRHKIAVGVWIPVAVLALAMYTGPNRRVGATPRHHGTAFALPKSPPTTLPNLNLPQPGIGKWLAKGRHVRTSAGSAVGVQVRAQLHFQLNRAHNLQAVTSESRKSAAAKASRQSG